MVVCEESQTVLSQIFLQEFYDFQEVFFFHQSGALPHISEGGLKRQFVLYRSAAQYSEDRFPDGQERNPSVLETLVFKRSGLSLLCWCLLRCEEPEDCTAFVIIR
mgnify:CR=1 FL=1